MREFIKIINSVTNSALLLLLRADLEILRHDEPSAVSTITFEWAQRGFLNSTAILKSQTAGFVPFA